MESQDTSTTSTTTTTTTTSTTEPTTQAGDATEAAAPLTVPVRVYEICIGRDAFDPDARVISNPATALKSERFADELVQTLEAFKRSGAFAGQTGEFFHRPLDVDLAIPGIASIAEAEERGFQVRSVVLRRADLDEIPTHRVLAVVTGRAIAAPGTPTPKPAPAPAEPTADADSDPDA